MSKEFYKYFGIFLIAITFIVVAISLFSQITNTGALTRGYGQIDYFYDLAIGGVLFSCLVIVLGFFPGLFFYRFGRDENESSKLVTSALILSIIATVIMIVLGGIIILPCFLGSTCDGLAVGLALALIGIPTLILYGIGIILLIIYKFKNKKFELQNTEKIMLWVLATMILIVGIIYGIAVAEIKL